MDRRNACPTETGHFRGEVGMTRVALLLIVGWQIAAGSLYALRTPLWQAPDEPAHYNYARQIADGGGLPVLVFGDYDQAYLERLKAAKFPDNLAIDSVRYEGHQPPLYYLIAAGVLRVVPNPYLVRLLSVLFAAVIVIGTFGIVRQILPARPDLALLAAALPAVTPQFLAITASVSNDALTAAILTIALLLAVRIVVRARRHERPPSTIDVLVLGLALAGCILVKVTAYVAVPIAVVAVLFACGRQFARPLALLLLLPVLAGIGWAARNMAVYGLTDPLGLARHDAIVVGQPLTGAWTLTTVRTIIGVGFQSFWGQFGWMGVLMDGWVYGLLWAGTVVAAIGAAVCLWDIWRGRISIDAAARAGLALVALTAVFILAGYLWYNVRFLQPQGRYVFAAMPAIGLFFAIGFRTAFSDRAALPLLALVYGGLAVLDLFALFRYVIPQLSPG